jgi:predicted acylesterase/phospholipase RssA/CRP-like cAMP-binding protein
MDDDIVALLKAHEYFCRISDDALREISRIAQVANYSVGAVVHQSGEPLTSVCFVVRGRLKAVRVDAQGREHVFRVFERGEQYGIMLGGLSESLPVRIFALESSTVVSLDHEASMELMFQHPDVRREWFGSYARSVRRHHFEATPRTAPGVLVLLHESPATRQISHQLIGRLRALGEEIGVFSDAETWRSISELRFRLLSNEGRPLDLPEIRRQVAEWQYAKRIVFDVLASSDQERTAQWMGSDRILYFVQSGEIQSALERLRSLDVTSRGWRDKISIVWLLHEGSTEAPAVPELRAFASRDFMISQSRLSARYGQVLSSGLERLVHDLRGIRIGVALGGGAARGMSHLGVLKALERSGIVVDMIAGTSAGAMTGVCYSAGLDCDYCASQFAADLQLPWLFRKFRNGGYWYLLYKYRRGQFEPMLRKYLADVKLEQLPLPCVAVSVDLVGAKTVVRDQGDAVHAIIESINLPGLSLPICRNGQALVDGGLMDNIPADVLAEQGCNFVIAVSVTAKIARQFSGNEPGTPTAQMKTPSTAQTLLRTWEVQNHNLNAIGVRAAEVTIEPDVTRFDLSEFTRAKELAAAGEETTLEKIPQIKQLLARLDPALFG